MCLISEGFEPCLSLLTNVLVLFTECLRGGSRYAKPFVLVEVRHITILGMPSEMKILRLGEATSVSPSFTVAKWLDSLVFCDSKVLSAPTSFKIVAKYP